MDIRQTINDTAMSRYQWFIVFIAVLLNALDGFDVLAMSFTANAVTEEFGLSGSQLGVLLSSALFGMAIVGVLAFNYHWNEFFRPLIFMISEQNYTLPLGLVTLQGNLGTGSISVVLAGVILSMVPAVVVFLFGQRYLREGLTAGSSK